MTTTYVQARDAIVTHLATQLATQLATVKIVWDNTEEVDITDVGNQFIQVDVDFDDAEQAVVGFDASEQVLGVVGFRIFQKKGEGTRSVLEIFDTLRGILAFRDISGVTFGAPKPGAKKSHEGWVSWDFSAGFTFYQAN